MRFIKRHIFILVIPFLAVSCCFCDDEKKEHEHEKPILTFAVAGHVYGSPMTFTSTVYPPFLEKIKQDNEKHNFDFLFLTGDVVAHPTKENWDVVKTELDDLGIDWYISRGNHDVSHYLDQNIQSKKYLAIRENSNLFLVLNSSFPGWTLDSAQIVFVKNELENVRLADNIFVLTHQFWWLKDTPYEFGLDTLIPNSDAGFEGATSFWEDIFPAFDSLTNPVYFFAGDIGAHFNKPGYYEDHFNNFHFYGSGMGGGTNDNYLIVSVYKNGAVEIERVDF